MFLALEIILLCSYPLQIALPATVSLFKKDQLQQLQVNHQLSGKQPPMRTQDHSLLEGAKAHALVHIF